jgi:glycosyltransferase involved in cell wall biosynthesis
MTSYARAACALVPSRYEGFGYALAEAQCAGVPVLAANAASLPEVAADPAGLLPPDDADAWAVALRALLADRDEAQRRADAARPAAVARFAWSTAVEALLPIYARVARGERI